jgi:hypothetical protein
MFPDQLRRKLDAKATPGWLVGYPEGTKGWIIWEPVSRTFVTSRDVIFDDTLFINDFNEQTKEKQHSTVFDPFLLSAEILGMVRLKFFCMLLTYLKLLTKGSNFFYQQNCDSSPESDDKVDATPAEYHELNNNLSVEPNREVQFI